MLRLVRPVFSALFGATDYSPLSVLPSYGKCFGSNPLPGQVVVAISVILAIRAHAHFHIWKRLDPVQFKDDADALLKWNTSSMKPLRGLQTAQLILSALLLFMAADSMETMATFRGLLLLLLLLLSFFAGMAVGSPGDAHQYLVGSTIIYHFSWALQTLLLPGIWALGDDFVRSEISSDVIVVTVTFSPIFLISWFPAALVNLPKTREEDLQRLASVEQAVEQPAIEGSKRSTPGVDQFIAWTRRDISAAMLVALVDLILLIGLQFA